jgi:hypothetical protein
MDLGPGETRVYSITDNGSVAGARVPAAGSVSPGFPWAFPQTAGAVVSLNIKPGYVPYYRDGAGLWLTWRGDETPQPARQPNVAFVMRKLNTGQDAIGLDIVLGSTLNWARSTPIRFSFGNDIWTDSAMWLFQSLYGPDDPRVNLNRSFENLLGDSQPFGTFAFGLRMANDGTPLGANNLDASLVNSGGFTSADAGIVSRGMLQSSPFTCYTELGDKSAQVLVYNGLSQASSSTSTTQNGIRYFGCMHPINAPIAAIAGASVTRFGA